jgi:hypothetical protein
MWPLMYFLRMIFYRLFHPIDVYYDILADEVELSIQKYREDHAM